ncbi:RING finger protein 24 [Heterocephalus glaber]|uniref:RING finger protein 24 n=1 Tax=Heterocephalus glaber TaxID=10181 RepID=G5B4V2_HETGA|nr:RING finger protein 24 [Heterocephalus glaber]
MRGAAPAPPPPGPPLAGGQQSTVCRCHLSRAGRSLADAPRQQLSARSSLSAASRRELTVSHLRRHRRRARLCAVCLEDFKPRDELGICPCKHAFHRKCLIKWLEVRKVCPLCNMPVLQLAQLHSKQNHGPPQGPLPGAENIV